MTNPYSLDVSTPCVKLCKLNDNDICVGCGRTRIEISLWCSMPENARKEIMNILKSRVVAQKKPDAN